MVLVAFAILAGVAYIAYTNQKGLRIGGLITLSPAGATTFFWVLALLSLFPACLAVWFAVRNHSGPGFVELGPASALVRKASLSASLLDVPYSAIEQVRTVKVSGQQMIVITSAVGEARLMSTAFATPVEFAAFKLELLARTAAYRS